MVRSHDSGFFELLVWDRQPPTDYQFQITTYNDETMVVDDPYNFPTQISDFDEHLMIEGNHFEMYEKMGAHIREINGRSGVLFAVWAPNAERVSVVGEFNAWDGRFTSHALPPRHRHLGTLYARSR